MASTMKKVLFILLFIFFGKQITIAQEWQSYHVESYAPYFWWAGELPLKQQFKINFYDSSFWFLEDNAVLKIKNDGQFLIYNSVNTTVFNNFLKFKDITFTTDATFVIDRDQGVYRYKDDVWLKVSSADELVQMSSDADTIWIGRINEMYFRIDPLSQTFGDINYLRRIQSKNGQMWGSSSSDYGVLHRKTDIGFETFSAAVNGLLDGRNYDFKFSDYSDTLYTCGDIGINLIWGDQVVDSIYPLNCTNMPEFSVLEFEIDEQHNIWAVFGEYNILGEPRKIAYFDRDLNEWTSIYDGSNSPIDFANGAVSIEIDPFGNLWVVNGPYLHVLKLGNEPVWLGMEEVSNSNDQVMIFPNPGRDEIKIEFINGNTPKTIQVTDLTGKVVLESISVLSDKMVIDVNTLTSGLYLLKFENILGQTFNERWVKQ
jgi:hypothetical protein